MNIATNPVFTDCNRMNPVDIWQYRGHSPGSLIAWIISPLIRLPQQISNTPLVLVHGINRDAEGIANAISATVSETGRTVVLPHFDASLYKRYQLCADKNRADLALLELTESLVMDGVMQTGKYDLGGFSGGAQFAHRFTWLYPHRVRNLLISSAGWYTFPDDCPYPYGLGRECKAQAGPALWMEYNLSQFLNRRIRVRVGELDNIVDHNTRSGELINAQQGRDRVSRAKTWTDGLKKVAVELDIESDIDYSILPDCGHDIYQCIEKSGLDKFFLGISEY